MDLPLLAKPGKETLKTKATFSVPEKVVCKPICLLLVLNELKNSEQAELFPRLK